MTHQSEPEYGLFCDNDESHPCQILHRGAHFSYIAYSDRGYRYEIYADNDDIIFEEDWDTDE